LTEDIRLDHLLLQTTNRLKLNQINQASRPDLKPATSHQSLQLDKMHAFALLALLPLALAAPAVEKRAPVITPRDANLIPGKYIVKLKDGASAATVDTVLGKLSSKHGRHAKHEYKAGSFKGFAAELDAASLDTLTALSDVSLTKRISTCVRLG
jgi:hypothetical protein